MERILGNTLRYHMGGSAVVEGFGFQTKTLALPIGPERMCVEEIRVRGPGCTTQPEIADPESGAWA